MERDIFICSCHNLEHQISFWKDEEVDSLYVDVHLNTHRNFFQRLWYGLKYAFGYKSRYGAWDEFIFKQEDLSRLKPFLESNKMLEA